MAIIQSAFGGDLRYALNLRNASDNNRAGELQFSNSTNANTVAGGASGLGILSVLQGQVANFERFDVFDPNAATHQKRGAFYGQDSWRVTPKLTVNYGVRWDIIFPETVTSAGQGGFTDLTGGVIRVAGSWWCGHERQRARRPSEPGRSLRFRVPSA